MTDRVKPLTASELNIWEREAADYPPRAGVKSGSGLTWGVVTRLLSMARQSVEGEPVGYFEGVVGAAPWEANTAWFTLTLYPDPEDLQTPVALYASPPTREGQELVEAARDLVLCADFALEALKLAHPGAYAGKSLMGNLDRSITSLRAAIASMEQG